jgi:hypothetical protein
VNALAGMVTAGLVVTVIGAGGCSAVHEEQGFTCADLNRIVRDTGHEPGRCYIHEGLVWGPPVTVTGQ